MTWYSASLSPSYEAGQASGKNHILKIWEYTLGTKKSGKGRRKVGRKKRRMRAKIRHRKK